MPSWKELKHANGSAEDLPAILSELKPDQETPAWAALWDRVCHFRVVAECGIAHLLIRELSPFCCHSGWYRE